MSRVRDVIEISEGRPVAFEHLRGLRGRGLPPGVAEALRRMSSRPPLGAWAGRAPVMRGALPVSKVLQLPPARPELVAQIERASSQMRPASHWRVGSARGPSRSR